MARQTPSLFLPYQQRAISAARTHDMLVVEKSRQIGITYTFAAEAALSAMMSKSDGGRNFHYAPPTERLAKQFLTEAKAFAELNYALALAEPDFESETVLKLGFPSGNAIYGHTGAARSLRGSKGNVLIDEAAHLDDLDEVLTAADACTMWGGSLRVVSTHKGAENPFVRLIEEVRAGKRGNALVQRVTLSDAISEGLFRRICLVKREEWTPEKERQWEAGLRAKAGPAAPEEYDCTPQAGSVQYLLRSEIERAMISVGARMARLSLKDGFTALSESERFDRINGWFDADVMPVIAAMPQDRCSYIGQDFGRSHDLSVIAVGQDTDAARINVPLIVELSNVPYVEQQHILDRIAGAIPRFAAAKLDATGNGAVIGENFVRRWGESRVEAVKLSEKFYLAHMPRLRAKITDGLLHLPRDADVLEDLLAIELVNGIPKIGRGSGKRGRHGDAAIALMHLVAAADRPAVMEPHRSAGRRISYMHSDWDQFRFPHREPLGSSGFGVVRSHRVGLAA
ncbi:terminase large subunit domain-containing protein [Pacificimonas sp. ICDLI1SI03]